jgi:hypothetical protein
LLTVIPLNYFMDGSHKMPTTTESSCSLIIIKRKCDNNYIF